MGHKTKSNAFALILGSIGVVFGDIGTSPLYAFKTCFEGTVSIAPSVENVLGILSLIFWSMQIVITIKFVGYILRVDDHGEGGIFPMLALLHKTKGSKLGKRLVFISLFGAALLYGDGVITPVISVLSALEGLEIATPAAKPYIVPLACAIIFGLFSLQSGGTERLGKLFGPVMVLWFFTIGGLGLAAIIKNPEVLQSVNPIHAVRFFMVNKGLGFLILGFVVLCITGCEALHADMGHFGRRPITISWLFFAMPTLTLNYFGQGAVTLSNPNLARDAFYALVPSSLLYPMIGLSTLATIIASQAIISGAFSQTRQAIQFGYLPRFRVIHTSHHTRGQIFINEVNVSMMLSCLLLTIIFRESANLAEAYGIAVTGTMLIATILFYYVAIWCWGWSRLKATLIAGVFFVIDAAFLGANLIKFFTGGWLPITLAALIMLVMTTWSSGWRKLAKKMIRLRMPVDKFVERIRTEKTMRVPGTAIFLSTFRKEIPPMLLLHHELNNSLHAQLVLLSIVTEDIPFVEPEDCMEVEDHGENVYRVTVKSGFMETPDVPHLLHNSKQIQELNIDTKNARYFIGRISLIPSGKPSYAKWRDFIFSFLQRNAISPAVYYNIPPERVLELGVQIKF